MTSRRNLLIIPILVAGCSIIGGMFGPEGVAAAAAAGPEEDIKTSIKAFTKVYDLIEENYADKVTADRAIYNGAIPGMLRTLDPHSNFFDPRSFTVLKEEQKGHYAGVGMVIQQRGNKTWVMEPYVNAPANKAGLRRGDVIVAVNDKSTEGLESGAVADLLKGAPGTKVQVTVEREGVDHKLSFNVVRDEIPRYTVPPSFMIRPGIGYVLITSFAETTSREMEEALRRLGESDLKGLILDVRGNPGGLLNEGVEVAGHFLKKGDTVVSHRGRASAEKPYIARRASGGKDYPIVVLVNQYSASAAEIVAGALQDHDRGWILGENTFGKGLVQTVFPLSENAGLALTTAHYYTPSGRLIQRDYSNISFLDYYYHKNLDTKNMQDVKMTDSGRTVYGGGGIAPDEKVVQTKANHFQIEVARKNALYNFGTKWFGPKESSKLPKGWEPDEAVITEFHDFLLKAGAEFTEAEFAENHTWVKQVIEHEFYFRAFGKDEADRAALEWDPVVLKGIDAMPKAKALLDTAKKMMVQRTSPRTEPRR